LKLKAWIFFSPLVLQADILESLAQTFSTSKQQNTKQNKNK
jgi:hypothetical protein